MPATRIHPTAIIEDGAKLDPSVEIGAYAYIGAEVKMGEGCKVHHHATVEGNTTLGASNEVFPYAFLGGRTQDKKWTGDSGPLHIGDRNIFREFTTVHPGTFKDSVTTIGSDNLFCSYAHVGHECTVGNHVIFSNNATLGGHVEVGNHVVIGGLTAIHQFCKIGDHTMVGGCCKLLQDLLPFMIAEGYPATHRTINKVGLQRNGFSPEEIQLTMKVYKHIFRKGLNHGQAFEQLKAGDLGSHALIDKIIAFSEKATRGLA